MLSIYYVGYNTAYVVQSEQKDKTYHTEELEISMIQFFLIDNRIGQ